MEPERLWALLYHGSEGRISRDRFLDMGEWDLQNVVFRPGRNPRGEYWPEPRERTDFIKTFHPIAPTKAAFKVLFFDMGRLRGNSEEEIQERWNRKHG